MAKKIVGIGFQDVGKIYWFNPNFLNLKVDDLVVVETVRGLELGTVVSPIKEVDSSSLDLNLKDIIRIASPRDIKDYQKNLELAKDAFVKAKKIIETEKIPMKTLGCEYTLDGTKLLIYYTADGRVDFRELVKILAGEFKVRIELRQIGPREAAKMVGGIGICGRPMCCVNHLREFDLVTMKMAKDQGMVLSANKIAGQCGKLLCCIAYECKAYEDKKKHLPALGDIVKTPNNQNAKVTSINMLSETIQVDIDGLIEIYPASKLTIVSKSKKGEKVSEEELELSKELEAKE